MKYLGAPQSGSQANTTASRNRFGQYYRNRAMPTQPRTTAQLDVRNNLTAASKAWASLSDAQRAAWSAWADAHPVTDALGSSISLTGHQAYISVNTLNLLTGQAAQTAPPDGSVTPQPDFSLTVTTAAGLSGQIATAVPATGYIIVFASPPLSQGRSFNGDFRVVNTVQGSAAPNQVVLTAALLTAKWGTLVAGQKFFFACQVIDGGNLSATTSLAQVLT
jgi:hypothetical protein